MKARVLDEPALEFRASNRHIDPRFGIAQFGPADADMDTAPRRITVGLVGTASGTDGLRKWLDKCGAPIERKVPKPGQENLFIDFPGFNRETAFLAEIGHSDALVREIPDSEIRRLVGAASKEAVERTASTYANEARSLSETGQCQVIFVVRPDELDVADSPGDSADAEHEEDPNVARQEVAGSTFHDILKAKSLGLSCPIQVIREETWTGKRPSKSTRDRPLQDEASRAWNLFTALYYKGGGAPSLASAPSQHSIGQLLRWHQLLLNIGPQRPSYRRGSGIQPAWRWRSRPRWPGLGIEGRPATASEWARRKATHHRRSHGVQTRSPSPAGPSRGPQVLGVQ